MLPPLELFRDCGLESVVQDFGFVAGTVESPCRTSPGVKAKHFQEQTAIGSAVGAWGSSSRGSHMTAMLSGATFACLTETWISAPLLGIL